MKNSLTEVMYQNKQKIQEKSGKNKNRPTYTTY